MFIPSGYITVYDAVTELLDLWSENTGEGGFTRSGCGHTIGTALANGELRSVGMDIETGILHVIPDSFWRTKKSTEAFDTSLPLQFSDPKDKQFRVVLPLILATELNERFGVGSSHIASAPKILPAEWKNETHAEAVIKLEGGNATQESYAKNAGGRPPLHDWDSFWIEVALYAAENDLEDQHWRDLQKHMEDWTSDQGKKPPDPATIRKKLQRLKVAKQSQAKPQKQV